MDEPLKPCPFCGGVQVAINKPNLRSPWQWMECEAEKCLAEGPVKNNEMDAVNAWNRRAGESQ
jgi:Lar family restriction alleviation protein